MAINLELQYFAVFKRQEDESNNTNGIKAFS